MTRSLFSPDDEELCMIRPFCLCMLAHSMAKLIRENQTIGDSFVTLSVGILISTINQRFPGINVEAK